MATKCKTYYFVCVLSFLFMSNNVPYSFAIEKDNRKDNCIIDASIIITPTIGYRIDNMDWNIAGDLNGQNPNILSELKFNDVKTYQSGITARLVVNGFYMRHSFSYGRIIDGESIDSDYSSDNRTGLFSKSEATIKNYDVQDIDLCFGYQFSFIQNRLKIAPLIGSSYHKLNYCITKGYQIVPEKKPIPGLKSSYNAKWKGYLYGLDIVCKAAKDIFIFSTVEYHTVDYEATADWNLRDDFSHPVSFTHLADGNGYVVKIGVTNKLTKNLKIGVMYNWQKWSAKNGEDRTFVMSENAICTRLNQVNFTSRSINVFLLVGLNLSGVTI